MDSLAHIRRRTTKGNRELRAYDVGEAAEKLSEVDPGVGQPSDEREDVTGSSLREQVEQPDEFVLGDEPQCIAHSTLAKRRSRRPWKAPDR